MLLSIALQTYHRLQRRYNCVYLLLGNSLKLENVKLSEKHAIIDGKLSNYNVNLESRVVHKQPGGSLCIIPVHSQHRGRVFLPFVDNDAKTATATAIASSKLLFAL
jgi:hypothetical protein